MEAKIDNPGVFVPPPLFYAIIFFISILIQKFLPINSPIFTSIIFYVLGWLFLAIYFIFALPAIIKFIKTKNTLITIKPAKSLQTAGIYFVTRNPMYLGLLFLYAGLGLLFGNLWTLILIPILIFIINTFVIKNEERYLERTFGESYTEYKTKTRRWI